MKRTIYHGTSADNLESILKSGLLTNAGEKIWNVSEDKVYCYDSTKLAELEGSDPQDKEELAFSRAFENAQCGLGKSKDCRAIIVIAEIDENELEDDFSCPNMEHASCVSRDIKLSEIKEIRVSNDLSLLKGYFLSFMVDRVVSNLELTHLEEKIARAMTTLEIYQEDVKEFTTWETVYKK